jgi:hypothetical protein
MYGRDFADLEDSPEWPTDEQLQDWNEANDYVNEGQDDEEEFEEEFEDEDDGYEEYGRDDYEEDRFLDDMFESQYELPEY